MLEYLLALDAQVMIWVHQHLHNEILDPIMVLLRNKWTWLPLYVFLLAFMLFNFKKRGWLWMLFFIFTIALSDTISTKVIKYQVQRIRPCHTELVSRQLTLLVPCGGQFGFVSSHASNHFAMAGFLFFTMGRLIRRVRWPVMIWAGLIAFAQVYVGVHYPLDVIAGGILGCVIGWGIAWYYNHRLGKFSVGHRAEGQRAQSRRSVAKSRQ